MAEIHADAALRLLGPGRHPLVVMLAPGVAFYKNGNISHQMVNLGDAPLRAQALRARQTLLLALRPAAHDLRRWRPSKCFEEGVLGG